MRYPFQEERCFRHHELRTDFQVNVELPRIIGENNPRGNCDYNYFIYQSVTILVTTNYN